MFHCFVHRSFSLTDFVADVQDTIKPVLTAYSKVTFILLRINPSIHCDLLIILMICWLCITPTKSFVWQHATEVQTFKYLTTLSVKIHIIP
jgi:hypothetical protein